MATTDLTPRFENAAEPPPRLGWRPWAALVAFYAACIAVATYPNVLTLASRLPYTLYDPLQHLWILRWYRACLLEGQSLVLSPELHYPVGAPLGCFSPLHLQAMLFIPLSLITGNDVLSFNLVMMGGLLFTALGTFALARQVVRDDRAALFGGLAAMLSGTLMMHASAHLELVYLGGVPLFLAAWLRFMDRPSRTRLATVVALYGLVAICAAYFAVFVTIPAALDVVLRGIGAVRRRDWSWIKARLPWLVAFAALVVPLLALLFANQIWAASHGYPFPPEHCEPMYRVQGTPWWSFLTPTLSHRLGKAVLSLSPELFLAYHSQLPNAWDQVSYLGVVTIGLIGFAAVGRVRFQRRGYWWGVLGLLVLLACGSSWQVGPYRTDLPAAWLKSYFIAFRMIRVPARFNLLATVAAAVVASAGLARLLAAVRSRTLGRIVLAALVVLTLADLSITPYNTAEAPPVPACYAAIKQRNPRATILEVPQYNSMGSYQASVCGYWQTIHRLRTNVGYAGQGNARLDNLLLWNSPFEASLLAQPPTIPTPLPPSDSGPNYFNLLAQIGPDSPDFLDYSWLYTTYHQFDYIVMHRWKGAVREIPVRLDRLTERLERFKVFEGPAAVVYDRTLWTPPTRPIGMTTEGWRLCADASVIRVMERRASLVIYNPDPDRDLALSISARALRHPRKVRLSSGGRELARWRVEPGRFAKLDTGLFRLSGGLNELTFVCDAEERPTRPMEAAMITDRGPYSLRVNALILGALPRSETPETVAHRP